MNISDNKELLFAGFNQDSTCFATGTEKGFKVFSCDPFSETFSRDFHGGGIGPVGMLFRTNILALVGGGKNPQFPPNKVILWDDQQKMAMGDLNFRTEIKALCLRRDRIVVVVNEKIYVYNFADLRLVDHVETCMNPKGLCCVSDDSDNNVLVCPGLEKGSIRVELYSSKNTVLIQAHQGSISALALNQRGTLVATASAKGTLVRVFDTVTGVLMYQLKRGMSDASIYSIAFSIDSKLLAVSSDRSTIHIFRLDRDPAILMDSRRPAEGMLSGFVPTSFNSERSFASLKAPYGVRTIVSFGSDSSILFVAGSDGSFWTAKVDLTSGGPCRVKSQSLFRTIQ